MPSSAGVLYRMSKSTRRLAGRADALGWAEALRLVVLDWRKPRNRRMTFAGERFYVRVGRGETDLQVLLDVWVHDSYGAVKLLPEPKWIVDAGANVGFSARWFAHRFPSARILAIEPDEVNFQILERNTASFPQIIAVQAALCPAPGPVLITDPGIGSWGFRTEELGSNANGRVVPGVTITQLMDDYDISRIDLLKLDIEGAERFVLDSSGGWMPRVDALVAELHDRYEPGCTRAFMQATSGFVTESWHGESIFVSRQSV